MELAYSSGQFAYRRCRRSGLEDILPYLTGANSSPCSLRRESEPNLWDTVTVEPILLALGRYTQDTRQILLCDLIIEDTAL